LLVGEWPRDRSSNDDDWKIWLTWLIEEFDGQVPYLNAYRYVIPREERRSTLCLFIRLSTVPFDLFSEVSPALADLYTDAMVGY
jgi:hypothetical protein